LLTLDDGTSMIYKAWSSWGYRNSKKCLSCLCRTKLSPSTTRRSSCRYGTQPAKRGSEAWRTLTIETHMVNFFFFHKFVLIR